MLLTALPFSYLFEAILAAFLLTVIAACLAFIAIGQPPLQANLIFLGVLIAGLAGVFLFDNKKWWQ